MIELFDGGTGFRYFLIDGHHGLALTLCLDSVSSAVRMMYYCASEK